jgi:hypothetical protein
LPDVIKQPEDC